ncbi:MAG: flagellar hook-associated protein FlgK [Pseudomonadota bacterium]
MSLSLALNNALSGINVTSRQADLISDNVANALSEGFGRRDVQVTSANVGGFGAGARISGVDRASNPALTESRRMAEAELGRRDTISDSFERIASIIGEPGDPQSLTSLADALDAALGEAADSPESPSLLNNVALSAGDYANQINRAAIELNTLRTETDASIAQQVSVLNRNLGEIEALNEEIRSRNLAGLDSSALQDERQRLIDEVSGMIPIRVAKREGGEVALFGRNGGQLLDGRAFELEFTGTSVVSADRSIGAGTLSGLSVEGRPIDIGLGGDRGLLDGGSLSAAFELRDSILPDMIDQVDGLAADLITRVQDLPEDPTLAPGDPGLFTDGGLAFDPANTLGLGSRIALNTAVDPLVGGDPALIRDGLNATALGEVGNATVLRGLQDVLTDQRAAPAATGITGIQGAAGLAAGLSSILLADAFRADEDRLQQQGRTDSLRDSERAVTGVDTDRELSRLLLVEQTFQANARVIEVVDSLLARLVQI